MADVLQYSIQTGIPTLAIIIVGCILQNQIKSQKALLSQYKKYLEAVSPDKVITLHKREVEQLESILTTDIKTLRNQVIQMGFYIDHDIRTFESMAASLPEKNLFNRDAHINVNLPDCAGILNKIREYRSDERS